MVSNQEPTNPPAMLSRKWQRVLTAGFMLFAGLYFEYTIRKEIRLLLQGEMAEGRVLEKYIVMIKGVNTFNLAYEFQTLRGESLKGKGTTNQRHYESVVPGDKLAVRYQPSDPTNSEPWQQSNVGRIIAGTCFLLVSLILAVYYVVSDRPFSGGPSNAAPNLG